MTKLTQTPAWRDLEAHAATLRSARIADLFAADPARVRVMAREAAGVYLDYSKQRATPATMRLLLTLAAQQRVSHGIQRMFDGAAVNLTENRPAFHAALRAPRHADLRVNGDNVVPAVWGVLDRMFAFADSVRSGEWRGFTGARITDVVNIGIGGSDLGPRMACEALADFADGPRTHFIANVDATPLAALMRSLDPGSTLWVITSKTFTTQETMANANAARAWFLREGKPADVARHFVAVSTNAAEVEKFGIAADNMFGFWDWVGGRYSLWSAVGLSIALAVGPRRFEELLSGAHAMDQHFRTAALESNLPVILALLALWNTNFLGAPTQVVAPYAQRLERFVGWLQQLEMESNGKSVDRDGRPMDCATTPALWGDVGTNAQHAFFQMLHQSPAAHPVDFIVAAGADHELAAQHRLVVANCLAQSAALMRGKTAQEVRSELSARGMSGAELDAAIPHRVFPGNRPSNTMLLPRLDPRHLGALLALYEHRTYVLSLLWNVNAFDQWGVELGKKLTAEVLKAMDGEPAAHLDASTRSLLGRITPP